MGDWTMKNRITYAIVMLAIMVVLTMAVGTVTVAQDGQQQGQGGDPLTHTVQAGENLFRIALRYGVALGDLLAANNITDPNRIFRGQVLTIPGLTVPDESETAFQHAASPNPCLNGTWYCADPVNPAREEWNWACGWYIAHSAMGEFSLDQIPEWCTRPVLRVGCYDSSAGSYLDQYYAGPLNTPGNATIFASFNGTCSSSPSTIMWVRTVLTTPADVVAFCNSLGGGYSVTLQLATAGFLVPSDIWACR